MSRHNMKNLYTPLQWKIAKVVVWLENLQEAINAKRFEHVSAKVHARAEILRAQEGSHAKMWPICDSRLKAGPSQWPNMTDEVAANV